MNTSNLAKMFIIQIAKELMTMAGDMEQPITEVATKKARKPRTVTTTKTSSKSEAAKLAWKRRWAKGKAKKGTVVAKKANPAKKGVKNKMNTMTTKAVTSLDNTSEVAA